MIHQKLNELSQEEAHTALMRCCGSHRWARQMCEKRPFANAEEVYSLANSIWNQLGKEDFLEAFSHHPQIGASREALEKKFPSTKGWSAQEQAGMQQANDDVIDRLVRGNKAYLEAFGYIFIVCATGKSAEEMCALLEERLGNDPQQELYVAAAEQAKITIIRLEKL